MNAKERDEHSAPCTRCGGEAQWSFLDPEKSRIEVICPDCGRYEMSREEFDRVAAESAELNGPESGG
jgi:predicted RNA-binding Zn-ribbon protein involved in translation (DUF1610 family)